MAIKYIPEPSRIKVVGPLKMLTRQEYEQVIAQAKYNIFGLGGEDCYIDLLTDSGANAMSEGQWAGIIKGGEVYAGVSSYYRLVDVTRDIFGYGYVQPAHQGRATEKVLFPTLPSEGKTAISNMFFDTTRVHMVLAGARLIDCVIPEAKDPSHRCEFKGNMDVEKLEQIIFEKGAENIGLVVTAITNNSTGGRPVSLQNMRDVSVICKKYNIPPDIGATRYAESTYFVKRNKEECKDWPAKKIIEEMFSLASMFTMSAKKDIIVNMDSMTGVKDGGSLLILKVKANYTSLEGFYIYGRLNRCDLEALTIRLCEGIDENYPRYRIGQMEYLASRLNDAGIAYQALVGGHGVFMDAAAMLLQIPCYESPDQVLAIKPYKETGIHTCDAGSYILGNDPDTNEWLHADFESIRLAIPCRVYTQTHTNAMADVLIAIKEWARKIKHDCRIIWKPPILRHFQASLEPTED